MANNFPFEIPDWLAVNATIWLLHNNNMLHVTHKYGYAFVIQVVPTWNISCAYKIVQKCRRIMFWMIEYIGCYYSLDWTTGLEYWTGLLD